MPESIEVVLAREAGKAVQGTWLVIMPASGTVMRYSGALLFVEVGGESKWAPFIVDRKRAIGIDPRALIVDDKTLQCAYHPRQVIDKVHAMAKEWFDANPDVFAHNVRSELARI